MMKNEPIVPTTKRIFYMKRISKFPTAKQRRKMIPQVVDVKQEPINKVVKQFVENKILPAVLAATYNQVNIEVPSRAYADLNAFCDLCKQLIPSDYEVGISYDGGGMYNTLSVSW